MQELGTDYIDSLIIHCVTEGDWDTRYRAVMDVISESERERQGSRARRNMSQLRSLKGSSRQRLGTNQSDTMESKAAHMDAGVETARSLFKSMRAKGQGMIGMKWLVRAILSMEIANFRRRMFPVPD